MFYKSTDKNSPKFGRIYNFEDARIETLFDMEGYYYSNIGYPENMIAVDKSECFADAEGYLYAKNIFGGGSQKVKRGPYHFYNQMNNPYPSQPESSLREIKVYLDFNGWDTQAIILDDTCEPEGCGWEKLDNFKPDTFQIIKKGRFEGGTKKGILKDQNEVLWVYVTSVYSNVAPYYIPYDNPETIEDNISNLIAAITGAITPGPWRVDPVYPHEIQSDDGGLEIALAMRREVAGKIVQFPKNAPTDEQAEANARLIAAAPELLKAAKAVKAWIESTDDWGHNAPPIVLINQAIEKAI